MRRAILLLALVGCTGCAFDASSSTSNDQDYEPEGDPAPALADTAQAGSEVDIDRGVGSLPRLATHPNKPTPDPWSPLKPTPDPWRTGSGCQARSLAAAQTGDNVAAPKTPK